MSKLDDIQNLLNQLISREKGVSFYEGYFDEVEDFDIDKERGPKPDKGYPHSIDEVYQMLWEKIKELSDENI